MTARPWENRRAEAFAEALDERTRREADLDHELGQLVQVTELLADPEGVTPRPEFATDLRSQLMAQATTTLPSRRHARRIVHVRPVPTPLHQLRRRLGTLAATFAIAGGSFGLVSQSAQALPGDMLYPVKRGVENTELALEHGPSAVGSARLDIAHERLEEVRRLLDDGPVDGRKADLVRKTLDDFSSQAGRGTDSLLQSYTEHGRQASVYEVTAFTQSSSRVLSKLSDTLPTAVGDSFAKATRTLTDLNSRAGQACSSCEIPDLTGLPRTLSARVVDSLETPDKAGQDQRSIQAAPPADGAGRSEAPEKSPAPGDEASGSDLPDVPMPDDVGQDTTGSSSDEAAPEASDIGEPLRKVTEPARKLLDPVLRGLVGTQQSQGSGADGSGGADESGGAKQSGGSAGSGGSGGDSGSKGLVPGVIDRLRGPH